ncbi:hypothetical protein Ate02nite_07070 [Paractinoplanes tereljensis]|uniref:Uncharacterized protein n=1 Tax=Paractinoplanes tereljensis TaxID=571912 RepID=A0A919TRD0_9ACTN|nr:hypothetical protein Ate02nite_07070 [Actinoplanes tereljensis]
MRRNQEASAAGIRFLVFFHLALRPEEQDLVRLYDLFQFPVAGWTVVQLAQGVQFEAGQPGMVTSSVIRARSALQTEQAVKDGCLQLRQVLTDLRDFDDTEEHLYELDA